MAVPRLTRLPGLLDGLAVLPPTVQIVTGALMIALGLSGVVMLPLSLPAVVLLVLGVSLGGRLLVFGIRRRRAARRRG